MNRRTFVQSAAAAMSGLIAGCGDDTGGRTWLMPEEGEPHARTWMAFVADERIWGRDLAPRVRRDLAAIATTIARFEPVSMLVRAEDLEAAEKLTGPGVELVAAELDDLWMRDTGPVFVRGAAVDFNFNGWGGKQGHRRDAKVAGFVAGRAGVERVRTDLVLEGGALEVDGEGTAIITESCVLNGNRNRGWTKPDVEEELGRLLGIRKVIWLPGIAGKDITDGHTDFYARFAGAGVVVAGLDNDPESFDYDVTRRHLEILKTATDADGRALRVEVLEAPSTVRVPDPDFAGGYVNFYVCNGAVIGPEFGDARADAAAKSTLERLFPGRTVVQINIDGIASGGGGIHCTTQQEPGRQQPR
ncbi:agmatine deiminase family protein [Lentzea sp. BCCO 10_0856]|uniref:Agmatine deiminase family protein n=1 Tax=Lentzea miocenica TaxID=3095431 RepID=A0ABU4SWY6_9PSEU|nr:agmatine deiminase family protein [Lentzea sp. BCCO 10_0856]MDX8030421.1 agmatine deiminase family protein [Lentzea sp. BCCO 10_0856]